MELIKEIFESDVMGESSLNSNFNNRFSTKVILLDENNKIAMIHFTHSGLYMLPGGKLDDAETPEEAAIRETKEETGCNIEIIKELGLIIDYKLKIKQKNYNYCYLAKKYGDIGERNLTENETKNGAPEVVWLSLDEAFKTQEKEINASEDEIYISGFIHKVQKELLNIYNK